MPVGSIFPGRIPNSLASDRLTDQLQTAHETLTKLQDQLATGQKLFLPSDSPSAASRVVNLQKLLERKTQMVTNAETNSSLLGASESALSTVSDALNRAKQLTSAGIGGGSSTTEKQAMADEAQSLLRQLVNIGNTTFRGRYLFGGSQTNQAPFSLGSDGTVRYGGDQQSISSYVDLGLLIDNNVDGQSALGALTPPVGSDINPALTMQTSISDLFNGQGLALGQIVVTLSNPAGSQTIDLSEAKTIGDIKACIENAFPSNALTVSINSTNNGLSIVPTAGTVAVTEVSNGLTAANLGIASSAAASIVGTDLNPRVTMTTTLASLNAGTGIGTTTNCGLRIVNGSTTTDVDISSAVTVEDLINLLRDPELNLSADLNADGNGLAVSSRLSGASFSIGENSGSNATNLGLRTFSGSTALADLNFGRGVPVEAGLSLSITRRDGTTATVSLSGSTTVQDVLDKINAVSAGHLTASLNTVGNGISLVDDSGTGPLSISAGELATALGLGGTEPGSNAATPLVGNDPNPREAQGSLNIMSRLQRALLQGDNVELSRLNNEIDREVGRVSQVRGELGGRLKTIEDVSNRLKDQQVQIQESLSTDFDADLTEVLSQLVNQQTLFEATLKAAAQTMQLSLINYL